MPKDVSNQYYATAKKIIFGLDAAKPASPTVSMVYVATDTTKLYVCYSNGSWTSLGNLSDIANNSNLSSTAQSAITNYPGIFLMYAGPPAGTKYTPLGGPSGWSVNEVQLYIPRAGTFKRLTAKPRVACGPSDIVVFTFRKNGGDGNQTITLNEASGTNAVQDLTHTDSVVAGDLVDMKIDATLSSGSVADIVITVEFA